MSESLDARNRAIYEEFTRLRGSSRYSNAASLHQALGVMFGAEDSPLSPNTVRKIIGQQRRVEYAETNNLPLDAVPPGFFVKKVSTLLDADGNTITQSIQSVNESRRSTEHQDAIPAGHRVKGVSTYLDEQGRVRGQWIKTDRQQQQWLYMVNGVLERLPQMFAPLPPVLQSTAPLNDLLALYPLADLHVGLYVSLLDGERNWNLTDCVETVKRCIDDLVSRTPTAARAVVAQLGDFTHTDNLTSTTPNSGARLDTSGRFIEIAQAATELAIYVINSVAQHHRQTTVVWQSGNHDEATALVMQTALAALYRDDARIHVHVSGKRTHVIQHHRVALGFSHGDTNKRRSLPLIMANDYPSIWAATHYRVWHVGHIHHRNILDEQVGCYIESHATPAPGDAYSDRMGYRSSHSMCSIVYDPIGEYSRNTVQVRPPTPRDEESKTPSHVVTFPAESEVDDVERSA